MVFAGVGWLAWRHAGWRFALLRRHDAGHHSDRTLAGRALFRLSVHSAILVCLIIGCPLESLAAKSEIVSRILRPVNDTLQSIPLYIFLIPAVALFQ